jgi:hypothetical protein
LEHLFLCAIRNFWYDFGELEFLDGSRDGLIFINNFI